jgi:hypothetical protein
VILLESAACLTGQARCAPAVVLCNIDFVLSRHSIDFLLSSRLSICTQYSVLSLGCLVSILFLFLTAFSTTQYWLFTFVSTIHLRSVLSLGSLISILFQFLVPYYNPQKSLASQQSQSVSIIFPHSGSLPSDSLPFLPSLRLSSVPPLTLPKMSPPYTWGTPQRTRDCPTVSRSALTLARFLPSHSGSLPFLPSLELASVSPLTPTPYPGPCGHTKPAPCHDSAKAVSPIRSGHAATNMGPAAGGDNISNVSSHSHSHWGTPVTPQQTWDWSPVAIYPTVSRGQRCHLSKGNLLPGSLPSLLSLDSVPLQPQRTRFIS